MTQILEHIYMKFVCKFEYDRPNSFRVMCTEKLPFFSIKKLYLPIFLIFLVDRFGRDLYQIFLYIYICYIIVSNNFPKKF